MLSGYAVPLSPRPDRMHGHAQTGRERVGASIANNLLMVPHPVIMHKALRDCKRLLHYEAEYALWMDTPNSRLKKAREEAGFETAIEAADALGIPRSTYIGHENGHRGFPAKRAPQYARRFKVSEEWLLYGKAGKPNPLSEDVLAALIEDAVQEIPAGAPIGEWPRLVAGVLHTQLEQIRSGSELVDLNKVRAARREAVPVRVPTKPAERAG